MSVDNIIFRIVYINVMMVFCMYEEKGKIKVFFKAFYYMVKVDRKLLLQLLLFSIIFFLLYIFSSSLIIIIVLVVALTVIK